MITKLNKGPLQTLADPLQKSESTKLHTAPKPHLPKLLLIVASERVLGLTA